MFYYCSTSIVVRFGLLWSIVVISYTGHGLSLPVGRVYQRALLRMRDLLTYHGGLSLPGPALVVRKLPYRLELPTHKQHLETAVAK